MFGRLPNMMSRAAQKAETRDRILAAARNLFEGDGFDATNIRRIADAAGVATGTVLFHFTDKLDLLHAALFEDLEAVLQEVVQAPPGRSLRQWLSRLVDRVLSHYEARPGLSRVLLRESLISGPPWAERFAGQMGRLHGAVAARAALALERGELEATFDPRLFAMAFLSYYIFGLLAWAQGSHPAPRALVEHLVEHHLAGYRATRRTR
ncbi:MAG: TetR/AcrR family transcriptional regulator [Vicinamibacterales bacterium]